jgi:hypothetical protein
MGELRCGSTPPPPPLCALRIFFPGEYCCSSAAAVAGPRAEAEAGDGAAAAARGDADGDAVAPPRSALARDIARARACGWTAAVEWADWLGKGGVQGRRLWRELRRAEISERRQVAALE